ncbi:MAG: hypothetical protein M3Y60_04015, partial [Bacteroidota bacterium]|nr:hypothetical protein [Bacteroidota bacterium]
AIRLFSSDWSVGITGYASPLPQAGIHELFAFYAIAFRETIVHRGRLDSEDDGILNVQVSFTNGVLEQFGSHLRRSSKADNTA